MLAFEKKGSSKPWLNSPKKNFKLPEASSVLGLFICFLDNQFSIFKAKNVLAVETDFANA